MPPTGAQVGATSWGGGAVGRAAVEGGTRRIPPSGRFVGVSALVQTRPHTGQ